MDPDRCFAEIKALLALPVLTQDECEELTEKEEALRTWMANGGFTPKAMQRT